MQSAIDSTESRDFSGHPAWFGEYLEGRDWNQLSMKEQGDIQMAIIMDRGRDDLMLFDNQVIQPALNDRPVRIVARGIASEIAERGVSEIIGSRVTNAKDLAAVMQIYRDPRFETMRYVFTKGDEVVGQVATGVRLPNSATPFPLPVLNRLQAIEPISGRPAGERKAAYDVIVGKWLQSEMDSRGADGYWLVHNHPSGNPYPSGADVTVTRQIANNSISGSGFNGHVIINGSQYGTIMRDGEGVKASQHILPDGVAPDVDPFFNGESDPEYKDFLNKPLQGPGGGLALLEKLQKERRRQTVAVLALSSKGDVRGILEIPYSRFENFPAMQEEMLKFARSVGASDFYAVGVPQEGVNSPDRQSVRNIVKVGLMQGMFHDALDVNLQLMTDSLGDMQRGVMRRNQERNIFGDDKLTFDQMESVTMAAEPSIQALDDLESARGRRREQMRAAREMDGRPGMNTNVARSMRQGAVRSVQNAVDSQEPAGVLYSPMLMNNPLPFVVYDQNGKVEDDPGEVPFEVLGRSIPGELADTGNTLLLGKRIQNPQDLAAVAQVYRDPRFETFRWVFTRFGEVVGEVSISARLPGATPHVPPDVLMGENTSEKQAAWVREQMARYGADGFYQMHNHPSGAANPSGADVRITDHISSLFPDQFLGHVIIDSGRFGFTKKNDDGSLVWETQQFMTPELLQAGGMEEVSPGVWRDKLARSGDRAALYHPLLGRRIETSRDLAVLMTDPSARSRSNEVTIVGTTGFGSVRGIVSLKSIVLTDAQHISDIQPLVAQIARDCGCASINIANVPASIRGTEAEQVLVDAFGTNLFGEILFTDGMSATRDLPGM